MYKIIIIVQYSDLLLYVKGGHNKLHFEQSILMTHQYYLLHRMESSIVTLLKVFLGINVLRKILKMRK